MNTIQLFRYYAHYLKLYRSSFQNFPTKYNLTSYKIWIKSIQFKMFKPANNDKNHSNDKNK